MNIQEKLGKLGINPGQNQKFLVSPSSIQALVEAGEIQQDHHVLEIGAGTGNITEKLLEKTSQVTAVETDHRLVQHLKKQYPEIHVIQDDFLKLDIEEMDIDRVVANLPFSISSEAIEKLGRNQIQSTLILQDELADKIVADPGDKSYGPFTVKAQYYFLPVKLTTIKSRNYHPKPEVDTAIVKLYPKKDRHGIKDEENFFKTFKALHTHKRKKVRNSFVDTRHILDYKKSEAKKIRDELPHSEERVINLGIKQLAEIGQFLEQREE